MMTQTIALIADAIVIRVVSLGTVITKAAAKSVDVSHEKLNH